MPREISKDHFEEAMETCLAGEAPTVNVANWLSDPDNARMFFRAIERLNNPFLAAVDKALEPDDA